jgi:hypothetical protein
MYFYVRDPFYLVGDNVGLLRIAILVGPITGEGGALALLAVYDHLLALVGFGEPKLLLKLRLIHAPSAPENCGERKVQRSGNVTLHKLLRLAHINDVRVLFIRTSGK